MTNLDIRIKRENKAALKSTLKSIATAPAEDLTQGWYLKQYITPGTAKKQLTAGKLRKAMKARAVLLSEKLLAKQLTEAALIQAATKVDEIRISVEWKKSQTWGYNPLATVEIYSADSDGGRKYEHFTGRASGCGYDKRSAAVSQALNQSPAALKLINTQKTFKPYGTSGQSIRRYAGGVGIDCLREIMALSGLKFEQVANGGTFDAYIIRKK